MLAHYNNTTTKQVNKMSTYVDINDSIVEQAAYIKEVVECIELEEFCAMRTEESLSWMEVAEIQASIDGYDMLFKDYAGFYQTIVDMADIVEYITDKDFLLDRRETKALELVDTFKQWRDYFYCCLGLREHIDNVEIEIKDALNTLIT